MELQIYVVEEYQYLVLQDQLAGDMTETGSRKFSASALSEKEPISVKRVKNDDSDYSTADSSSESQDEGEKLQRMTSAIRTIIEVGAE